jgi:hypothetical protein
MVNGTRVNEGLSALVVGDIRESYEVYESIVGHKGGSVNFIRYAKDPGNIPGRRFDVAFLDGRLEELEAVASAINAEEIKIVHAMEIGKLAEAAD